MGFTRNYKNLLFTTLTGNFRSSTSTLSEAFDDTIYNHFKATDGSLYTIDRYNDLYVLSIFSGNKTGSIYHSGTGYTGLVFGTGDTAESFDDYKLASQISSLGVNGSATTTYAFTDTGAAKVSYSGVFTATTTTTIKEFGCLSHIYYSGSSKSNAVLLFRKVLSTPITLEAGVPTNVTIEFEVPNPIPTT